MNTLLVSLLVSQNLFAKTYGADKDKAQSVILTMDGGYALTGGTRSSEDAQSDLLVVRLDGAGNLLWARAFGGNASDWAESIIQTPDGGFMVLGNTLSFGAGGIDLLLLKIDSSGNLMWAKTFGGSGRDQANAIIRSSDGGFMVVGEAYGFGTGYEDLLVMKLSEFGDPQWIKVYGTQEMEEGYSIIQTSTGDYAIAGSIAEQRKETTLSDILVLKIDSSGNPLWAVTYEGSWWDGIRPIAESPDGGYVVAGGSDSWFYNSLLIMKMTSVGELEWARLYGNPSYPYSERAFSIISTPEGGFIVGGYEWISGPNTFRVLLIRINSLGEIVWARTLGDTGIQYPNAIVRAQDNSYVLAGSMGNSTGTTYNCLMVKLDTAGNYPDCLENYELPSMGISPTLLTLPIKVIGCTLLVDTPELVITVPDLRVNDICSPFATGEASPSPSGWLALFPAPRGFGIADYSGKALVYDPTGRLVLSREITGKTLISPLRPGVYFVVAGSQRARITVR